MSCRQLEKTGILENFQTWWGGDTETFLARLKGLMEEAPMGLQHKALMGLQHKAQMGQGEVITADADSSWERTNPHLKLTSFRKLIFLFFFFYTTLYFVFVHKCSLIRKKSIY